MGCPAQIADWHVAYEMPLKENTPLESRLLPMITPTDNETVATHLLTTGGQSACNSGPYGQQTNYFHDLQHKTESEEAHGKRQSVGTFGGKES
jgi:hypothetical protein